MLMTRGTKAMLINNTETSFYNFISYEQLVGGTRDHTNTHIVDRNILYKPVMHSSQAWFKKVVITVLHKKLKVK